MTDGKDILLDSLLSETLRGEAPPDLTGRILAALENRKSAATIATVSPKVRRAPTSVSPSLPQSVAAAIATAKSLPASDPIRPTPIPRVEAEPFARKADREIRWQRLATAACLSAVALSAAVALLLFDRARLFGPSHDVAVEPATPGTAIVSTDPRGERPSTNGDRWIASTPRPREFERPTRPVDPVMLPAPFEIGDEAFVAAPPASDARSGAAGEVAPTYDDETFANAAEDPSGSLALIPHLDDFRVLSQLDSAFEEIWNQAKVDPAPEAAQLLWVRRAYLHVLGRIPTVAELREASDKLTTFERQRLVISLTERDEFFDRWAETLAVEALGPADFESSPVDRRQFQVWLAGRLREGVPFHEIVADMISAEGSNDPQAKDFDPAVNFLLATVRTTPAGERPLPDDGALAASRTARAFLGERAQCVQCHDHPENDWKQPRFWQLAAFFQQTRVEDAGAGRARIVDRSLDEPEMVYADPSGQSKSVLPEFRDFRIDPNGDVDAVDRREELAELVALSPDVYRALVHRVWRRFFGYGLAPVVDDLGPHRAEYFPQVVDLLASESAAHGGRLQDLVRWLALSEPFRRGSAAPRSKSDDRPEEGTTPYFSRYYVRPLEPSTIYDSLLVASESFESARSRPEEAFEQKSAWLAAFRPVRDSDEDPHVIESFDPTAPMILEMMNGDLTAKALATDSGSYLSRLAQSQAPPAAKFEHLFLTAFARMPNPQERMLAAQLYQADPKRPEEGLQNLWWALLNSNEFILDH